MDDKIVFIKTAKGEEEADSYNSQLSGDAKRVFILIDGRSTVGHLRRNAAPSLRPDFDEMLERLINYGFIRDKDAPEEKKKGGMPKMATPKMATPKFEVPEIQTEEPEEELDFTSIASTPSRGGSVDAKAELQARIKAEAEAKVRAEAAAKLRAEEEAAARAKAQAMVDARAKAEAEARARAEEEKRMRAEAEARARAEAEARARAEAVARARAEAEAKARAEAEARARAEDEKRMRAEAEARARAEVEARMRAEAEARERAEAEIRARADEEIRMRKEAEARARAELEAETRMRKEQEARAREEEEARAKSRESKRGLKLPGFDALKSLTQDFAQDIAKELSGFSKPSGGEEQPKQDFNLDLSGLSQPGGGEESPKQDFNLDLSGFGGTAQDTAASQAKEAAARKAAEEQAAARRKAEQAAAAKRKAEEAAAAEAQSAVRRRAEQEAEAARIKAQQAAEAARARAEQEAAKIKAEEEQRKLAEEQAKAFAEAEKRARKQAEAQAKVQAKAEVQAKAKAKVQAKVEAKQAKKQAASLKRSADLRRRMSRKPFPLGKIVAFLLVLVVAAALALPYVWPLQEYTPLVEKELSAQLRQPVHIGSMTAASLPFPRLSLQNVTIGGRQQLQIGQMNLYFDPLTLPADTRTLNQVELSSVVINAASFGGALSWLQAIGNNARYPVKSVVLQGARVSGDVPALPAFDGHMDFAQGRVIAAALTSVDGKVSVNFLPQHGNSRLEVDINDSTLPFVSGVKFKSFSAGGTVADNAINFSNINGSLYGGFLKGNAYLTWAQGWQLRAHLDLDTMDVDKALPGLKVAGEVGGSADLVMSGDHLMQLARAARLSGNIAMKGGTISNLDIAETARAGKKQVMSGITTFDSLSSAVVVDNNGQHLRNIRISVGATDLSGSADASPDGKLSGHILVDMNRVRAGMGTMTLGVGGTVSDFKWSSVH